MVEVVDRAGADHMGVLVVPAQGPEVAAQAQADARMIQHALEQAGVALGGHALDRVAEVPVIVVAARRDVRCNIGGQLGELQPRI